MKQYDKSAASFVCVINLVPYSIMARYRLALSYDNLGKYSLAREQLQWVLADASEEAKPLKVDAQKRFDEIKDLPDKGAVVVKPPVDPAADKAARETAEKARIAAEAEKARLAAENQKKADAEKARLAAEARKKADAEKAAREANGGAPVKPAPAPGITSRWWFWTGIGATVVFTGAALGLGKMTLDARDKWETDWNPDDRSKLEDFRLFTDLAIVGAVVSAAALGVGILLARPKKTDDTRTGWTIVPACGPEGCMMTFSLGF